MTTPILDFEVLARYPGVELSDIFHHRILDIISWRTTPQFPRPGRTAWVPFPEIASICNGSPSIAAAKIKGVGLWNPSSWIRSNEVHSSHICDNPIQPLIEDYAYVRSQYHFRVCDDGTFTSAVSERAPLGGITVTRAFNEYNNAALLFEQSASTIRPYLLVRYKSMPTFAGDSLGAVVTLHTDSSPCRLNVSHMNSAYLSQEEREYLARIYDTFGLSLGGSRYELLNLLGRSIGRVLRQFAEAGLCRHSGGWDNYLFCPAGRSAVLTDLDSSVGVRHFPRDVQCLHLLRDLGSTIYKLLNKIYHPSGIADFSARHLLHYDPIASILSGYFPEVDPDQIMEASNALWTLFLPHFNNMKKVPLQTISTWSSDRRRSYKMDQDMFMSFFLIKAFGLFTCSTLKIKYESGITIEQVHHSAERYLEDRYGIIQSICSKKY